MQVHDSGCQHIPKRLCKFLSIMPMVLLFVSIASCSGSGSDPEDTSPTDIGGVTASTTLIVGSTAFDQTTVDQIVSRDQADDGSITLKVDSSNSTGRNFEVGKPFVVMPGSDDRYPLGLSGKIKTMEVNEAGENVVTLEPISLNDVVEDSVLNINDVTLSAENFIGVIAPEAVRQAALSARPSALSLPSGAKSALNGAVIVHSSQEVGRRSETYLGDSGSVSLGEISLNLPIIELGKMSDDTQTTQPYGGSLTPLKLKVEGKLSKLKLVQTHVKKNGNFESFNFSIDGELSAELNLSGSAKLNAGYFDSAWDEVEDVGFDKFGISGKVEGLDSNDKRGDYPLLGLVFSVPCSATTSCPVALGQTEAPIQQAKAGGVIIWVYYTLNGEISLKGEAGSRSSFGFKLGAKLDEESNKLVKQSEIKEPASGRMLEPFFVNGTLDYEATTGISIDVDFFASGVRPANISLGVLAKIKGGFETDGEASYGITGKDDSWGWDTDGELCMNSSLGAGLVLSASVGIGIELDTIWKKASLDYEYTNQIPSEEEIDLPGRHGLWYTFRGSEHCLPVSVPTGVLVIGSEDADSKTDRITWKQTTRYVDIYTLDGSTGALTLIKSGYDLGESNSEDYLGYFTHEKENTDPISYVLVAVDEFGNTSDATSGASSIGFEVTNVEDVNTISWSADVDAEQYDLQFTKQSIIEVNREFTTKENVESPASHLNIAQGETWYYKIRYTDANGLVSPWSRELSVTRPSSQKPDAPENVIAQEGDGSITIAWSSVDDSESYKVYLAEEPGVTPANYTEKLGGRSFDDATSPYKINGLDSGVRYYAVVTAISGELESLASVEVSETPLASPVPTAAGKLNDTGITQCADGSTNGLSCPVSSYPNQDAQTGRDFNSNDDSDGHAGFSFTKLDANGNPLLANATSWSCVKDNVTGLIWEVKQGGNGTVGDEGLHDADDLYNWYSTDSSNNGSFVGYEDAAAICHGYSSTNAASYCNTQSFVERVNQAGLCGANDWRLPTRESLRSIASYDRVSPAIDTDYFPQTSSSWYWSSSPDANYNSHSWIVSFNYGYDNGSHKSHSRNVRLVRGGQ